MPVDVVKTRLQMDGAASVRLYRGSLDCAMQSVRAEGLTALWTGLSPALLRQSTYGSLRYGLYLPLRNLFCVDATRPGSIALWKKVTAGAVAGALASGIANPTDLVKVRMQTHGMSLASAGTCPKKYKRVAHCFGQTVREEGILGLWTGVGPTMGRATALAAAELSTYDEVKHQLQLSKVIEHDGLLLHVCTAFVSGFMATLASSPFDVVKSRIMGQPVDANGRGVLYSGMLDCIVKLIRH